MAKRVKKTVPPREERLAAIGDPKTPRMGGITPKSVEVPEVDDLLSKMKKATAPREVYKFVGFDLGGEDRSVSGRCNHGCSCGPCRRGDCGRCTVDAQRNADRDTVRAYVARYRGIELP
jgi:hypothetical protein